MARPQRLFSSLVSLTFLVLVSTVCAQTNPNVETGFKPYGSYDDTGFDSISLTNFNLVLHIPIFNYPQRGNVSSQLELMYNNKGWFVQPNCTTQTCSPIWSFNGAPVRLIQNTGAISVTWKTVKTGTNTFINI